MIHLPKALAVDINETIFPPAKSFPDLGSLINTLVPNILVLGGVAFLAMLIIAGFRLISKAGSLEPAELKKIQDTLAAAFIGLILIIAAYWIIRIIEIVTGMKILSPNI